MASDYGRQGRLAEVARYFNDARALGAAGRQDGSPQPSVAASDPSHPLDPENYYGLAYLYARQKPEVWPTPVQTEAPGAAFRRDFAYGGTEARRPEGAPMGSSEALWSSVAVRDSHATSAMGFGLEVAWEWLVGLCGSLGVITMAAVFIKRHKLALTLWSLALVAWLIPGPL